MKQRKRVYLLTGLMHPLKVASHDAEPLLAESIEDISLQGTGVRLKRVFLTGKDRITKVHEPHQSDGRFVFYINDGAKDDSLAQRFADAVMSALALLEDLAMEDIPTAVGFREDSIKKGKFIRIKDIIGTEGVGSELYFRVMHCVGVPSYVLDEVWRIVPAIIKSNSLMDATYFYRESIMQAWVADDDVFDIVSHNSDVPASLAERARIETAYQNAYKAIEAVIGEPPRDERKLRMKLLHGGINPDEKVGYDPYGMSPGKEAILEKLLSMQQTRDKKAAHGKTGTERVIGYCELKDKQAFARHLLLDHISYTSGDKGCFY